MSKDQKSLLADIKFYESYSRWIDHEKRYENWNEAVERVMKMHKTFYAENLDLELLALFNEVETAYKNKYILGSQRSLQFGGKELLKHHMRNYNCTCSFADRPEFFGEAFYVLLCGAGVGFSVQKHHIAKLPNIAKPTKEIKTHVVEDSIEGWATALDVLLSSFFENGKHPEYFGYTIVFDTSKVRKKGTLISGGFKAPGPKPLAVALEKISNLINARLETGATRLRPIDVYDITMHASNAVLSGGVRRSATICLFSIDDEEMANAKTGNWFEDNPQRGRSNNSAVVVRNKVNFEQFSKLIQSVKEFGEPGFVFVDSTETCFNPCVEIGMHPVFYVNNQKLTGWQGCNLTEINGGAVRTKKEFLAACRAAAILGTLQAGYTSFPFLGSVSESIFKKEALLGVSITGWMDNPNFLFDSELLKEGAEVVKTTNLYVANLIGINPAARSTCVKPSGNASVLLQTSSGIHATHAKQTLRMAQMNRENEIVQYLIREFPEMVEDSVWSENGTDVVVSVPMVAPNKAITKDKIGAIEFLEKVKMVQASWVESGTTISRCVDKTVRHNVSNTVEVKANEWDDVAKFLFENRGYFSGISLLPETGDRDYAQAPFTKVLSWDELNQKWGHNDVATAKIEVAQLNNPTNDIWFGRFKNADRQACLKDVFLTMKWNKIQTKLSQRMPDVTQVKSTFEEIDIDTLGAAACSGGACEIQF